MAHILVVDDDPDIRAMIMKRVQLSGHRVLGAGSASETLSLVADRGVPDLVVLDVSMPDMDGLELLGTLQSQQTTSLVPAIFLSGRVTEADIAAGRARGARYLTKPFVAAALISAIEGALAEAGAASSE